MAVDFFAFFVNLFAFFDMRKRNDLKRASVIGTVNIFLLLLAVIYFGNAQNFTLVWILFFPIFAIFINGSKKGFIISTVFYFIAFIMTYKGVDIWLNGLWNYASFLRFIAANMGMLFVTYFIEKSFEETHKELAKSRKIEEKYISALKQTSITDPLTQLYNRRHLSTLFQEQFHKAKKHQSYFAFYILDLDNFKMYNDTYGHIAGDSALKEVADVLKKSMRRDSDSVFRLGGEEFSGLLMADTQEKIQISIEMICKNIENLNIKHEKSPHRVLTVSIGVCIIHDFNREDFDKMYKIADKALYEAKASGRNCVKGAEKISTL
jgi:diguanylate cyclase (GGDEF)-like protein